MNVFIVSIPSKKERKKCEFKMDLKNFFVCALNSNLGNDNIISAQRPGLKTGMDFRGLVWIICLVEILKLNHEMIVWKIVLPDYLAGVCHYARPNWLWYFSGRVTLSRKVV